MQADPINASVAEDPITAIPSCALDEPGLRAQRERYRELGRTVSSLDRAPERVRVRFDEQLDRGLLEQTLEVERACCPFFVFAFRESERSLEIGVRGDNQLPALEALADVLAAGDRAPAVSP